MTPLISLIIPVYNVEPYLNRCLKSIEFVISLGYEVIIVNDGSTDDSQNIINSFISKHNSIIYVYQNNKGLSSARNTGLKYATGEYVWFIDSDDFIDEIESLNIFNELNIDKDLPDIVVFGRVEEYSSYTIRIPKILRRIDYCSGYDYFIESINNGNLRTNAWDKIFRRSFIDNYNIKFVEDLLYEDMLFCLTTFMYSGKVSVIPSYPYHYIHYNSSSITKQVRKKDLDVIIFIEIAFKFVNDGNFQLNTDSREFKLLIFKWVSSCIMNKYAYLSLYNAEAKYIIKSVLDNKLFIESVEYCSQNKVGLRHILFSKLLLFSPFMYKIILQIALKFQKLVNRLRK